MTQLDLVREFVELQVPVRRDVALDWDDVLRRADAERYVPVPPLPAPQRRRRRLVMALAVAAGILVAATALAATLGGFDAWLRGAPGKPAPEREQRRFEAEGGRSWAAFPTGTELRELIRTTEDGREFVLYGFRSGNSLCLRLDAVSLRRDAQGCAPVSTLARQSSPLLVVTGDETFQDNRARPSAQVSFGIVADGVSRVEVEATDDTHRALVGGNAYLFVQNEPNTTNRVLRITAIAAGGRTTADVVGWRMGLDLVERRPTGPTKLEARIDKPTVGWHARGEKRGVGPDEIRLTAEQRRDLRQAITLGHVRLVKPDPLSDVVVGLAGNLCQLSLGGSRGATSCSPRSSFFSRGPINWMISGGGGSEFVVVQGVAADGVDRVTIFLADGQRLAAPLRHNLFAALVSRSQFPARIVAYDASGRIVGIETPPFVLQRVPAAARQLRPVLHVRGPNGASAELRVSDVVQGVRCWRADFSTGPQRGSCVHPFTGPKIEVNLVQPARRDVFIVGSVHDFVTRVQLQFEDGDEVFVRPAGGHFVVAVPRDHLSPERQFAIVRAFDRQGHRVQRRGVLFRAN